MAEFSLGLTKTAVEGTLSLVKSAVEEEKKLKEKVQNDLVFISDEFEMMQSFLRVANSNKNDDQVVLTWVRQLRTLAFDVEDCVENVVHLDLDNSLHWGWLRRLWQTVNCRAPPLPLDDAVAEIKQLKARVEDVSHRNARYNLTLHGSNNNNNNNNNRQPQQPAVTVVMTPAEQPSSSAPPFHILRDAWEATGKWCHIMCNLQQELLIACESEDDHDLQVISVWGSTTGGGGGGGGSDPGTASIFRKAYRDSKICENFKIRIWVKLMHPFNHYEFVKSLLAQFSVSSSHQANTGVDFSWTRMKAAEVMEAYSLMKAKLMEQRYLVVLEDLFMLEDWDVIRMYLPDSKNGSRIVVSTSQFGVALMCTGEPYQVSELRRFPGDNQFLCAFFKKKLTLRDMGELYRQLRRHGVISVWGADGDDKSNLIDILYKGIIYGWFKEFEWVSDADKADHVGMLRKGIRNRMEKLNEVEEFDWHSEFERHSWVNVPDPFNLKVFARRLFLNFHSDDIRASKIIEVGMKGEEGLIQWCREFLFVEDYLVVIYGLQSKGDWDLIESTFFSSKATTAEGCILVITNEETVATHCVKDHKYQAFDVEDLKADPSIASLINGGSWLYGIKGMKGGRLFKDRSKDALEWTDKFENVGGNNPDEEEFGVFTVGEGAVGIHLQGILRHAYYVAFQEIKRRSWVDVSYSLDVTDLSYSLDVMDFAWRLLLDFYSDDPQAKETLAVGLMEGTVIDPIEKCREILRNEKCLVVINELGRSTSDWDLIKHSFLSDSEPIQSIIIVSSSYSHVNTYCSPKVLRLGSQKGFGDIYKKECGRIFYYNIERCQKALEWIDKFVPVGNEEFVLDDLTGRVHYDQGVISVWGIAGVGKSSLVRTVYYNQMLHSAGPKTLRVDFIDLFEAFGWVDVPSPFNLTEFAWRLLLDLYSDVPQAMQTATISSMTEEGQDPILECCKILQEIRCLVVIDGLCSTQDWDLIKATFLAEPINEQGAIVVITNEEKLAIHCVENDKKRVLNVRRLEADAALNLFGKIVSRDAERSKSIVAKCGGLPKVIAAIGETCKSIRKMGKMAPLTFNFMGTLETDPEFHGLRPLFSWMQSYFDACSDSLKPCIFYLSIFSAEKNIRRRRLLCRWIAEGYCRDTSDGTTCEENGEKFISELVKLSIVQQYSPRNKVFCQINSFFHEYIISRPMEDNLVFALEGRCSLNSTRGGQHLTIRSSWDRDEVVYESIDFSRLRSLTVFGKWESFFISNKKVNMRLLRVLDLEDATDVTNEDLEQIAKLLPRLKFLSLRGCREITRLPSSMGGLRQLQTLDIRHTSIVTLPLFITKLEKLRYLRAGTTEVWDWEGDVIVVVPAADGEEDRAALSLSSSAAAADAAAQAVAATIEAISTEGGTNSTAPVVVAPDAGNNRPRALVSSFLSKWCRRGSGLDDNNGPAAGVTVPADIGKLVVLHTLGVVKVNAQCANKAIFQELKKLTQLRKLGVSGINKGNIKEFCSAVSGHAHLKSLSVELDKDYGNLDELDDITRQLSIRRKLKLDMTIAKPEEFPNPQDADKILSIHHLRIRPIQGGELHIGRSWRWTIIVEIQCSSVLHIKFGDADWWCVEVLKVHFSGGSQSSLQISGLSNLESLEEVWLKGYTDAHKQYMQQLIDEMELVKEDQKRPVLKLVQPHSS